MENQVIELDKESLAPLLKEVADEAVKGAVEANKAVAEEAAKAAVEAYVAATEKVTEKKSVDGGEDAEKANKGSEDNNKDENPISKESKELRLMKAAKALVLKDYQTLRSYNAYALEMRRKANYNNEANEDDGSALVPDPEFDTTVYENLPKYGVAFADAATRQTDRNQVRFLGLDAELNFVEVSEAGVKPAAKMDFDKDLVTLRKFALLINATDELTEDSAIDFWNLVTNEITRAYAKKADQLVFTDATSGIIHTTGVITTPVSGAGTTITWDNLLSSEGKGEDALDISNRKWYMRKETWFRLLQTKASGSGEYLWESFKGDPRNPATPWGTLVVFTRVLPTSAEVGSNAAFAVYGDLRNTQLVSKRGLRIDMSREALSVDSAGANLNLWTQNLTGMRFEVRMVVKTPVQVAPRYVVLGTGTVS